MKLAPRSPIDTHAPLRRSRAFACSVATIMVSFAVVEAGALAWFSARKSLTISVSMLETGSGRVEAAQPARPEEFAASFSVVQSCLIQYVLSRETFDATDLNRAYKKTRRWSAGIALHDYDRLMKRTTPESPLNIYTPDAIVAVSIRDVSQLAPGVAVVRFETQVRNGANALGARTAWISAINYTFSKTPPVSSSDADDPTGFVVTRYQRDREANLGVQPAKAFLVTPPLRSTLTAIEPLYAGQTPPSSNLANADGVPTANLPTNPTAEAQPALSATSEGSTTQTPTPRKELAPPAPLPLAPPQGLNYPLVAPPS